MRSRWRSSTCCDKSTSFVFSVCAPWRSKLRTAPVASPERLRAMAFSAVLLISSRHSRMDSEYGGKMLHALAISSHSPRVLA